MKLTDSDKIDIARYVVELLTTALQNDGPYDTKLGEWMKRAEGECHSRLGSYLKSYRRIGR